MLSSKKQRRALAAFSTLYSWEYLTFFSDALTRETQALSPGIPESTWAAAGLAILICSTALLLRRRTGSLNLPKTVFFGIALLMGGSCLAIWFAGSLNVPPHAFACLVGLTLPFLYLYRVEHFPDLEEPILGTFFGLASICALLGYLTFILLPAPCAVAFCAVAPLLFVLATADRPSVTQDDSNRSGAQTGATKSEPSGAARRALPLRPVLINFASLFVLVVWLNFAFFRVIAAPWDYEARSWYYPAVSITTLVVVLALLLFVRKAATHRHRRGQARFAAVAFAVGYLILYIRFYDPLLATIAFAFCFACMIALEALAWSFWVQTVGRDRGLALVPLLVYLMAKGAGIAAGVVLGEQSCLFNGGVIPATAPLFFLIVLFACTMAVRLEDFDKLFVGSGATKSLARFDTDFGKIVIVDEAKARTEGPAEQPRRVDSADKLAERYALSPRETEVERLLLAGRNRPFIKQALFISTGTVNSHISSIYRKAGVKSQQELISLAEDLAQEEPG